ncbi:polyprenyl synthetase family protein [Paenisporosarcina cavernae]|uniref:Farnesyl diphosphate synthase n=2 Tax=Paenisporosarcina cavernae TaxID=2320858 RepID=A0A385YWZ8_9BACL|nr:polyprenyl synthetase family protein [Paenisporosarcina cavernae]
MLYSLKAGGKRIRPALLFATLDALQCKHPASEKIATAVEMIHTYSLIHDDLPSMDNDDLRRGKPTNHIVYGEALAILSGDALLTYGMGMLAQLPNVSAEKSLELIRLFSKASGAEGMVGGQVLDLAGETKELSLDELEMIHRNKTGALLSFPVIAACILADTNPDTRYLLEQFAHHLGIAFQIQDDILDIEGNEKLIGKTVGKDERSEKSTYPSLLTLDGAKEKRDEHYEMAIQALHEVVKLPTMLQEIASFIVKRDR